MSNRDIGQEILDGIREIKAYKFGQGELRTHTLKEPTDTPWSFKRASSSSRLWGIAFFWNADVFCA
jgi:hypothetical protein